MNTFCKAYDKNTATNDLGLPLRTTSDVNIIVRSRATLKETYEFAISDLITAMNLLSDKQAFFQRPTKDAARGYLAKIYLNMGEFQLAYNEVNEILKTHYTLLDFNNTMINYNSTYRFPANGIGNPEILFYARSSFDDNVLPRIGSLGIIPPEFYDQYNEKDLRKKAFFVTRNGYPRFIGCYTGTLYSFSGIATNELFLIRAECAARLGKAQEALDDLNLLLKNRYVTGNYSDYTLANVADVLGLVLVERRKELPFTANIRGEDLRRLNKDPKYHTIIKRIVNGQEISIMPNDSRYTFPIPDNEIQMSGIPQN
ncbi:Starch-binding associating with outer membrane [compost metagenome]